MSPSYCRRVSAVLSVIAIAVVCYSLGGGVRRVVAADNRIATETKPSEVGTMEVPGAFKELPEAKDAITSKHETSLPESAPVPLDQLAIDEIKGVFPQTEDRELLDFHATAYCLKGKTASGEHVRTGVIAADPKVLPLGTVVHLRAGRYTGTYTVLDTGGRIRGRLIDVYVPTYKEAVQFGRRPVKIRVLTPANPKRKNAIVAKAIVP